MNKKQPKQQEENFSLKPRDSPYFLDLQFMSNLEPVFAITVEDGHCTGFSILNSAKKLPNGIHTLYAVKSQNS